MRASYVSLEFQNARQYWTAPVTMLSTNSFWENDKIVKHKAICGNCIHTDYAFDFIISNHVNNNMFRKQITVCRRLSDVDVGSTLSQSRVSLPNISWRSASSNCNSTQPSVFSNKNDDSDGNQEGVGCKHQGHPKLKKTREQSNHFQI